MKGFEDRSGLKGRAAALVAATGLLVVGRPPLAPGPAIAAPARTAQAPSTASAPAGPHVLARAIADDAPLPVTYAESVPDAPPEVSLAGLDPIGRLVAGPMETVLYGPDAGPAAANAARLLAHKLDLTRDLALGDHVRLLVRRGVGGAPVLDYVELETFGGRVRLYRRADGDGAAESQFADADGAGLERLLLRTPLDSRRINSGFGLRRHPLLGYTRLHRGVDFAAPVGARVLAAGDGVVEQAGWGGGYGRVVRVRHAGGIETLYAHLSAWAPGLVPGTWVRQGETIAWTGASGLVTGPHLHFEVIAAGVPVDPAGVGPLVAPPSPAEHVAFEARKARIDARLARAG